MNNNKTVRIAYNLIIAILIVTGVIIVINSLLSTMRTFCSATVSSVTCR